MLLLLPLVPGLARADVAPNSLRLSRTATTVQLTWQAGVAPYPIYRSTSPYQVPLGSHQIAVVNGLAYDDPLAALPADLYFFLVGNAATCVVNSDCADGNLCNGTESCNTANSLCVPGTAPDCNDLNACTSDSCAPASGCTHANLPAGAGCHDLDACTVDACDGAGTCVGHAAAAEACNGQDDDCDGQTDEGMGSVSCGIGACARTVVACSNGVLGTCAPGTATSNDANCDGVDDDCDGAIDEDCIACTHVAPNGNDAQAAGNNNLTPFLTVQAAVNWAAGSVGRPPRVCVASGSACGTTATYTGALTMANGISVYGKYQSSTWARCAVATTILVPLTATGVYFPPAVSAVTVLDGFSITRATFATTAGVTVQGAHNVVLSGLAINNAPAVTNSYGIDMSAGAQATITRSSIDAGTGSVASIAIRSIGSKPRIVSNCPSLDVFGRCDDFCGSGATLAIRGRQVTAPVGSESYSVLLQDSPGASVETSTLCGAVADYGASVRIAGDGTGILVRGNLIDAFGGTTDSSGVWMEDCGGAAPWVVDNYLITSAGNTSTTRAESIRSIGNCHPVIEANVRITGTGEGAAAGGTGVFCGANASGTPSRCAIVNNADIEGSAAGFPPTSFGVHCAGGGCVKIAGNFISGRAGGDVRGLVLEGSGPLVDNNEIRGGCPTVSAAGVYAIDSSARLQNNRISADGNCANVTVQPLYGLRVSVSATGSELDVHSNVLDGAGKATSCSSYGLFLDVGATPPASGMGIYRNNIVRGGVCSTRYVVRENNPGADPRIFENNDLDPTGTPLALYVNEGASSLNTAAAVNTLTDMIVSGVISTDALFVNYPLDAHLTAGSPCIGAGTAAGAPATDLDGQPRTPPLDIGPDEFGP
jgi:hypothetical protein